ncbi:ribonuclease domain-containing protein [Nocardioides sp. 1609]|uniref:ribonuclease domain-containing protein n=1 Tax=Nocardioides sp. 1609 TaxID=2508327 RepID=UPI001FD66F86|nr:ribonuclease domain-containing protein [Nocardioides sp. 1609]
MLVLVVAVGIWLINGGDPGTPTGNSGATPIATDPVGPEPSSPAGSSPTGSSPSEDGVVAVADLPPEAAGVIRLIDAGGPYPYRQDGGTFGNYEGLLPDRGRGYYEEFTVPTPGEDDRGARRIIAGADGELYWTADHYASFERILR